MKFATPEQARSLFGDLFRILLDDEEFAGRMRASNLTAHVVHSKPDLQLFLTPDELYVDEVPGPAAITIKMSCDTADNLWSGRLLMPIAVATGRVRIRGSVSKVLEFVPILQPAFDRYPALAAAAGLPA